MPYSASKYNHIVKTDREIILYNFLYKNMMSIMLENEKSLLEILATGSCDNADNKMVQSLIKQMFLVDDSFDEFTFFKYNYYKSLYDTSVFRNTVLPTLSCNLRCPYCYEYKRNVSMSEETIDAYIRWVTPFLSHAKAFHLEWFGGEPLVRMDIIEKITARIYELQKRMGFVYRANITTNGVLMSPELIHRFDELNIESVQISLDGDKEFHDQYRVTPEGNGSFETIMRNVQYYCEYSKSPNALMIRINVTDRNYDSIPNLLRTFTPEMKRRCCVFFRWIYENSASNFQHFSSEKRGDSPFHNIAPLYQLAQSEGIYTNNLDESASFNFCECDFINKYRIDPEGNLFLCTQSYDKHESVGSVHTGGLSLGGLNYYSKMVTTSPFDSEECFSCKLLPMCKGGCRKAAVNGKRICTGVKHCVDNYIIMLYNKYRMQK